MSDFRKPPGFGDGKPEDAGDDKPGETGPEQTPEDQTSEDQSSEQPSPQDPSPEDSSPVDHSPEDPSPEEQTPEKPSLEDSSPEEQSPQESSPEELTTEPPPWLVPEDDSSISKDGLKGSRLMMMAVSVLIIVLFGGAIWYFYSLSDNPETGEVPLIEAPDGPDKIEPEDRGGLDVPDQDKLVFDLVSGDDTQMDDQVMDAPEQPMDRPGEQPEAEREAADVMDEAPAPAEPEPEAVLPGAVDLSEAHWVQLASFGQESAATVAWSRLQQQYSTLLYGLDTDIQRAELADGRVFYRLRTGPFSDRASASGLCRSLKAAGQDCLVVSP